MTTFNKVTAAHMVQKNYMDIIFDPVSMELMKQIKRIFDPNNILNRDKILKPGAGK
jgi:FAD/FMN-containing dehydrogenase